MPKVRESGMPDLATWGPFFNPDCIVARLDCPAAGDILEVGCGHGLFTVAAAKATAGRVVAIDIDPEMVAATARLAAETGCDRVTAVCRDIFATDFGAGECYDYVMLFNILHHDDPRRLLSITLALLRPAGKLGVIHWKRDTETPRGPPLAMRPSPAECQQWAADVGFKPVRQEDLCCCSWHWGLVLTR